MKIGVYFCKCGENVSGKINADRVREQLSLDGAEIRFQSVGFLCSEEGVQSLTADLKEHGIERVVIAACSPREHEGTFMRALSDASVNPFLMQMANIREQVAWVTEDPAEATEKAARQVRAALHRVALHEPLRAETAEVCGDALVVGAGPAGIKAALALAEAGRTVVLVERSASIGGAPVKFEEVFPNLECAPCMLEPPMGELLHGPESEHIELLTLAEIEDVVGFFGNYDVRIRQQPRFVDTHRCIGCAECIAPCPVTVKNEANYGRDDRKAISFAYAGALPNAPRIDPETCLRTSGQQCTACRDACPVEDTILFDQAGRVVERKVGAIILATGSAEFDVRRIPGLGYGKSPDILTGLECERLLASNGPTGGEIRTSSGAPPRTVAIVHCAGSLDERHAPYCSGICCSYAFKFNHLIRKKSPGVRVVHLYKEIVTPGKEGSELYLHARHSSESTFLRFESIDDVRVEVRDTVPLVSVAAPGQPRHEFPADLVVLCAAMVPRSSDRRLAELLEVTLDAHGFFNELHGRMNSSKSTVKGVFLAGSNHGPADIRTSVNESAAAAGHVLSALVEGRALEVSPVTAHVSEERCSGCRVCVSVCPYRAITFQGDRSVSAVNPLLCQGCGTCVAACPAGAMQGRHFTREMIMAEIDEVLR